MKKFIFIFILIISLVFLSSCKKKESSEESIINNETEETETINDEKEEQSGAVSEDTNETETSEEVVSEPKYYTVSFYNYDGSLLLTIEVKENEEALFTSEAPLKPSDDEFDYEFIGWDKDITNITSDLEVVALFKEVPKVDWSTIDWF